MSMKKKEAMVFKLVFSKSLYNISLKAGIKAKISHTNIIKKKFSIHLHHDLQKKSQALIKLTFRYFI